MISPTPILVAGAGIAGLAAAIGLARKGFAVKLLERRTELPEAGAGVQIGPNGVKALACLGLRDAVEAIAFRPEGLTLRHGISGQVLTRLPWGAAAHKRYGAPFLTLLRAELQAALRAAAKATQGIELVLGFEVGAVAVEAGSVSVRSDGARTADSAALIGADGVWSRVRGEVCRVQPAPAGYLAYRAVIPRGELAGPFDAPDVGLWIGRDAHVVHYPVSGGALLNIVVVVAGSQAAQDWDVPGRLTQIAPFLSKWPQNLADLLARAPGWRCWPLYDLPDLPQWSRGPVALIGDAAHPVLPFFAQGAAMALEDAAVLAECASAAGGALPQAFAQFARLRRPRVQRLSAASRRNGRTYHLSGAGAAIRDALLRATPPAILMRQFDWLYGFDPAAAPKP